MRSEAPFKKALLYAPLYPIEVRSTKNLSDVSVLLSMGKHDPIVPLAASEQVINLFKTPWGGDEEVWVNGHEITRNWINGWSTNTWEITVLLRSGKMEKIFTFHLPLF